MRESGIYVDIWESINEKVEYKTKIGDRKTKWEEFVYEGLVPDFIEGLFKIEKHQTWGLGFIVVISD